MYFDFLICDANSMPMYAFYAASHTRGAQIPILEGIGKLGFYWSRYYITLILVNQQSTSVLELKNMCSTSNSYILYISVCGQVGESPQEHKEDMQTSSRKIVYKPAN